MDRVQAADRTGSENHMFLVNHHDTIEMYSRKAPNMKKTQHEDQRQVNKHPVSIQLREPKQTINLFQDSITKRYNIQRISSQIVFVE